MGWAWTGRASELVALSQRARRSRSAGSWAKHLHVSPRRARLHLKQEAGDLRRAEVARKGRVQCRSCSRHEHVSDHSAKEAATAARSLPVYATRKSKQ